MDFDDIFPVGMGIIAVVFVVVMAVGIAMSISVSNNYNHQFSVHCRAAGGTPVIGDSDACFKDNRIIFQENGGSDR
jgi:hypothetical protein